MRIKYESPELEIFKFSLDTKVLTASNTPESSVTGNVVPGGGDGGIEDENPFG